MGDDKLEGNHTSDLLSCPSVQCMQFVRQLQSTFGTWWKSLGLNGPG